MATPASAALRPDDARRIFESLERDWLGTLRSPTLQAEAAAWAAAEPALRGWAPQQLVAGVRWDGYRVCPTSAPVLSALLRQALSPLAARALLQAMLPRIRRERVHSATYGHGVGENWQRPADTVADLVAECFAAIKRHAGEDRRDVDHLVVSEAARRLRTARQVQRRYQSRTVPLTNEAGPNVAEWLNDARSWPEWLALAVVEAVRAGRLSREQAQLLYATRVRGLPAAEAGRANGLGPKAVYYALGCAEQALFAGSARAASPALAKAE